jgi:hypothetical protein
LIGDRERHPSKLFIEHVKGQDYHVRAAEELSHPRYRLPHWSCPSVPYTLTPIEPRPHRLIRSNIRGRKSFILSAKAREFCTTATIPKDFAYVPPTVKHNVANSSDQTEHVGSNREVTQRRHNTSLRSGRAQLARDRNNATYTVVDFFLMDFAPAVVIAPHHHETAALVYWLSNDTVKQTSAALSATWQQPRAKRRQPADGTIVVTVQAGDDLGQIQIWTLIASLLANPSCCRDPALSQPPSKRPVCPRRPYCLGVRGPL